MSRIRRLNGIDVLLCGAFVKKSPPIQNIVVRSNGVATGMSDTLNDFADNDYASVRGLWAIYKGGRAVISAIMAESYPCVYPFPFKTDTIPDLHISSCADDYGRYAPPSFNSDKWAFYNNAPDLTGGAIVRVRVDGEVTLETIDSLSKGKVWDPPTVVMYSGSKESTPPDYIGAHNAGLKCIATNLTAIDVAIGNTSQFNLTRQLLAGSTMQNYMKLKSRGGGFPIEFDDHGNELGPAPVEQTKWYEEFESHGHGLWKCFKPGDPEFARFSNPYRDIASAIAELTT